MNVFTLTLYDRWEMQERLVGIYSSEEAANSAGNMLLTGSMWADKFEVDKWLLDPE